MGKRKTANAINDGKLNDNIVKLLLCKCINRFKIL